MTSIIHLCTRCRMYPSSLQLGQFCDVCHYRSLCKNCYKIRIPSGATWCVSCVQSSKCPSCHDEPVRPNGSLCWTCSLLAQFIPINRPTPQNPTKCAVCITADSETGFPLCHRCHLNTKCKKCKRGRAVPGNQFCKRCLGGY